MTRWFSLLAVWIPLAAQSPTSSSVARGDRLFAQGCAVGYCHGAAGAAARSPRLRGRAFERSYLAKVIRDGIPNTAMPAWRDRLTDADINALVDYIATLANAPVEATASPAESLPANDSPQTMPAEHARGRELFFDLTRESRCSVCHRLDGIGVPVGPDITNVRALLEPDAHKVLRFGRPRGLRTLTLKEGGQVQGVVTERTSAHIRIYDLSTLPPVLRTIPVSSVSAQTRQSAWRHSTPARAYSQDELQAVWDFVRWFAAKPKQ
jgi:mono/diheme cytochrome c family protein